jgi:hypothetical protein
LADDEVLQLRSRSAQTFNVPKNARLRLSLAAALLEELFHHPSFV